jgi:WD40 repeat protein
LDHHIDVVPALAFSPNGQWLASAGYDTSVRMWRPRHEDLITEASSRLTRNLTPEEWQHYLGEEEYRQTCTRLAAAATD